MLWTRHVRTFELDEEFYKHNVQGISFLQVHMLVFSVSISDDKQLVVDSFVIMSYEVGQMWA